MGRHRTLRPKEILRALERAGFIVDRMGGSHVVLKRYSGDVVRTVVIPLHNHDIKCGTFHNILRQASMTEDELFQYL